MKFYACCMPQRWPCLPLAACAAISCNPKMILRTRHAAAWRRCGTDKHSLPHTQTHTETCTHSHTRSESLHLPLSACSSTDTEDYMQIQIAGQQQHPHPHQHLHQHQHPHPHHHHQHQHEQPPLPPPPPPLPHMMMMPPPMPMMLSPMSADNNSKSQKAKKPHGAAPSSQDTATRKQHQPLSAISIQDLNSVQVSWMRPKDLVFNLRILCLI